MPERTATISLKKVVDDELVLKLARDLATQALLRPPAFIDGEGPDGEDSLFADYRARDTDLGYFSYDEAERRSRRVDLRGPTDRDPGPLQMEEADEAAAAIELSFR